MAKLPGRYEDFRAEFPEIGRAHDEIASLAAEAGPLSEKTAQLVKLGMAIAAGLEGAVHSHVRRALEAGATRDEVRHVGLLALTTRSRWFPPGRSGWSCWCRARSRRPSAWKRS